MLTIPFSPIFHYDDEEKYFLFCICNALNAYVMHLSSGNGNYLKFPKYSILVNGNFSFWWRRKILINYVLAFFYQNKQDTMTFKFRERKSFKIYSLLHSRQWQFFILWRWRKICFLIHCGIILIRTKPDIRWHTGYNIRGTQII